MRRAEPLRGLTLEIPVRFAECDPYGVVWHGHYALYLEQAREALTGKFGFTAARALAMGYSVPITRMELKYRAAGDAGTDDPRHGAPARPRRRPLRHGLRDPQRRAATSSPPPSRSRSS